MARRETRRQAHPHFLASEQGKADKSGTLVVSANHSIVDGADLDGDGRSDRYLDEPVIFKSVVHVIEP